jgi:glycerol-3-phosphate acyltransferase PlsX
LGTKGICVISHGSSNARAIVNAVRVAVEAVEQDLVGRLAASVTSVRDIEAE